MLSLPIAPEICLAQVISPALARLPKAMDSRSARILLLAIGAQESAFAARQQVGGPAHGLWQFELAGVLGILRYATTSEPMHSFASRCGMLTITAQSIYDALLTDDTLAAGVARLLLWSDRAPLPDPGDADAAWSYYLRNWRPGKPRPDAWAQSYARASAAVQA